MRTISAAIFGLMAGVAWQAAAAAPSADCRDGAPLCRDAYEALEKCEAASAGAEGACTTERQAADSACKSTVSACDRDGSRRAP